MRTQVDTSCFFSSPNVSLEYNRETTTPPKIRESAGRADEMCGQYFIHVTVAPQERQADARPLGL
jgi:hypothetical protein